MIGMGITSRGRRSLLWLKFQHKSLRALNHAVGKKFLPIQCALSPVTSAMAVTIAVVSNTAVRLT
jgi:hypothetical protein